MRKSFDLLNTRKAFLEREVVELVYKFNEKFYCECLICDPILENGPVS